MRRTNQKTRTMVGIFWLIDGQLIYAMTPLVKAERNGIYINYPEGHYDYWTVLQSQGAVPRDMEYEELPRGRVLYNSETKRYALLADRCILQDETLVAEIMQHMGLPMDDTDPSNDGPDGHYWCSECMAQMARR